MSEQYLGSVPSGYAKDGTTLIEPLAESPAKSRAKSLAPDLNGQELDAAASIWPNAIPPDIEDARALVQMAREQLARDIADIEQATIALRRGEPALQSWSHEAMPAAHKPRPLWLLIGVLWLSTAIVTVSAAVAIAVLAG